MSYSARHRSRGRHEVQTQDLATLAAARAELDALHQRFRNSLLNAGDTFSAQRVQQAWASTSLADIEVAAAAAAAAVRHGAAAGVQLKAPAASEPSEAQLQSQERLWSVPTRARVPSALPAATACVPSETLVGPKRMRDESVKAGRSASTQFEHAVSAKVQLHVSCDTLTPSASSIRDVLPSLLTYPSRLSPPASHHTGLNRDENRQAHEGFRVLRGMMPAPSLPTPARASPS